MCLIVNLILPKGLLLSSLYFFANGEIALQYKIPPKKDEISETLFVVVSMRGTTGVAESLRVVQLLDELRKL